MPANFQVKTMFKFAIIAIMAFFTLPVYAYVASSTNYRMESDSINVGGIESSTSTNYRLRDSIGEIGTGSGTSTSFNLYAGYRQMDETFISISGPDNINLSPAIGGVSGGTADGNGAWIVKTDNPSGYSLSIKASTTPAMGSGADNIDDYTPATSSIPDYNWDIGAANSEFGYSPYNPISQAGKFKNNTSACNNGSTVSDTKCWLGLSMSDEVIAMSASRTDPAGENTTVNFRGEVNAGGFQVAGAYVADITVTAISN